MSDYLRIGDSRIYAGYCGEGSFNDGGGAILRNISIGILNDVTSGPFH